MMPSTRSCNACGADNQAQARFCHVCGRPLQASRPTLYNSATGQLLANVLLKQRYRIIGPLGQGGFGAVYRAEDTQLGNRQVALKEMSQSSLSLQKQKEAAQAFEQEAMMLARLPAHPNLPSIFDHFEENNRWYLIMSFIEGETLEAYLSGKPGGRLPLEEVVDIGIQLCTVLNHLHQQNPPIVFRDLKPANIMRTPDGHIYLIDFGIARHFKPGQPKDTSNYGSNGYAPPEQYGKAQTTPRSDIYSLGATLHQLLSGHNPSSTPFHFPALRSLTPAVPVNLAAFITQMLEMDEAKRPANVLLVKQRLQTPTSPGMQNPNQPPPSSNPGSVAPTPPFSPLPQPGGNVPSLTPILPVYYPPSSQILPTSPSVPKRSRNPVTFLVILVCVVAIIALSVGIPLIQRLATGQTGNNSSAITQTTGNTTMAGVSPTPTPALTPTPTPTPTPTAGPTGPVTIDDAKARMKSFCFDLGGGDTIFMQEAYDQMSIKYQAKYTEPQFANMNYAKTRNCTYDSFRLLNGQSVMSMNVDTGSYTVTIIHDPGSNYNPMIDAIQ